MVKLIKKYLITALIALAIGVQTTQAHIFNIQKLVKGSHTVVLLSDFHSKLNAEEERNIIVNCAKACGGALVVEDSSTPLGHNVKNQIDGSLYQWPLRTLNINQYLMQCSCPTTVFTLYSCAVTAGIAASNIEFRFDYQLTLRELFSMIQKKKEKFARIAQNSPYRDYYESCLHYLKTNIEEPCAALFEKLTKTDMPFPQAMETGVLHATEKDIAQANKVKVDRNYKLVVTQPAEAIDHLFNDYCNFLLEMEMMLAVEQYSNYKTVFVCAGGMHNAKVAYELLKHGYRVVAQEGHQIPDIIDPKDYHIMEKATIDLEKALNTVCKEESHASILATITMHIGSIFGLIKTFATSLFA